jgi:hypothetical protein
MGGGAGGIPGVVPRRSGALGGNACALAAGGVGLLDALARSFTSACAKKLSSSAIEPSGFQSTPSRESRSAREALPSVIQRWSTARLSNVAVFPSERFRIQGRATVPSLLGRKIRNW